MNKKVYVHCGDYPSQRARHCAYRFSRSEEIVGKTIVRHVGRDRFIIATKVGLEWKGKLVMTDRMKRQAERIRGISHAESCPIDYYFLTQRARV